MNIWGSCQQSWRTYLIPSLHTPIQLLVWVCTPVLRPKPFLAGFTFTFDEPTVACIWYDFSFPKQAWSKNRWKWPYQSWGLGVALDLWSESHIRISCQTKFTLPSWSSMWRFQPFLICNLKIIELLEGISQQLNFRNVYNFMLHSQNMYCCLPTLAGEVAPIMQMVSNLIHAKSTLIIRIKKPKGCRSSAIYLYIAVNAISYPCVRKSFVHCPTV